MRKTSFTRGAYSFRPSTSPDGKRTHWTIYRKGERTWSTASMHMSSDCISYTLSMIGHETDARPDLSLALALMLEWLGLPPDPVPAPRTYLDRFPAHTRPYADRAYEDGFADGAEAAHEGNDP